jgi:hypothetical protein
VLGLKGVLSLSLSHFIYVEYVSVNLLIRLSFVSDFFDAANEGLLLADPGSGNADYMEGLVPLSIFEILWTSSC